MIYLTLYLCYQSGNMFGKKAKKRSSKDKLAARKKQDEGKKVASAEPQPPDYGGLPDIDLKKNLGCG